MSDPRDWPFDSHDVLRVPFIFVPHGAPEPRDWLASHPGAIKIPARFVPTGHSSGAIEADFNEALMTWLARETGDGVKPVAQPEQDDALPKPEARLADMLASSAFGADAGGSAGTNLDSTQMKFVLGAYRDLPAPVSQVGREPSEKLPGTWLADWRPPQDAPVVSLADRPRLEGGPEASTSASPTKRVPRTLAQAEGLVAPSNTVTREHLAAMIFNET